jgi:hypothetical protein
MMITESGEPNVSPTIVTAARGEFSGHKVGKPRQNSIIFLSTAESPRKPRFLEFAEQSNGTKLHRKKAPEICKESL